MKIAAEQLQHTFVYVGSWKECQMFVDTWHNYGERHVCNFAASGRPMRGVRSDQHDQRFLMPDFKMPCWMCRRLSNGVSYIRKLMHGWWLQDLGSI